MGMTRLNQDPQSGSFDQNRFDRHSSLLTPRKWQRAFLCETNNDKNMVHIIFVWFLLPSLINWRSLIWEIFPILYLLAELLQISSVESISFKLNPNYCNLNPNHPTLQHLLIFFGILIFTASGSGAYAHTLSQYRNIQAGEYTLSLSKNVRTVCAIYLCLYRYVYNMYCCVWNIIWL